MTMEIQELKDLNKKVEALAKGVEEIKKAILGDEYTKDGYKHRIESLETRMDQTEDFITKWKWILAGACGLGGYGTLTFIQQIIELINNHKH